MTADTNKNATSDNPCLKCPHRDTEGNSCSLLCLRLAAFNSGKDWEDEPLPYIAKQKKKKVVRIMEETETEDQKPETEDPGDKPESKNICVICHDATKPILNLRSKTCRSCYQAWNVGKIDHPTLGKFKPSLTKSKIKTSGIKKASPESQPKATQPKKENSIKSTSRSYPFPDLVTLDFNRYPEIKAVIFERVDKFLLPAEHIVMSMLAGMIAGKDKL